VSVTFDAILYLLMNADSCAFLYIDLFNKYFTKMSSLFQSFFFYKKVGIEHLCEKLSHTCGKDFV